MKYVHIYSFQQRAYCEDLDHMVWLWMKEAVNRRVSVCDWVCV